MENNKNLPVEPTNLPFEPRSNWRLVGVILVAVILLLVVLYLLVFKPKAIPQANEKKPEQTNTVQTSTAGVVNQADYATMPLLANPVNFSSIPSSWGKLIVDQLRDARNNSKGGELIGGWETRYSLKDNPKIKIGIRTTYFKESNISSHYFVIDNPGFNLDFVSLFNCSPWLLAPTMGCSEYNLSGKQPLDENSPGEENPIYTIKTFYIIDSFGELNVRDRTEQNIQKNVVIDDLEKGVYYIWTYSEPVLGERGEFGERDDLIEYQKLETMFYNMIHKPSAGVVEFDNIIDKFLQDNSSRELDLKKY